MVPDDYPDGFGLAPFRGLSHRLSIRPSADPAPRQIKRC